jgi:general secretion pathway protein K
MLDELRDWQDSDTIAREHGGEISTYRQHGLHVAPRNGPLETIDELRQIPSWNTPDLDRLTQSLTVYTDLAGVTPADAAPEVLGALKYAQANHWRQTPSPADISMGL